jgi:hypothetical protein
MNSKRITYRKIGKKDGGEFGKNLYKVKVDGISKKFSNSRAAKRFMKMEMMKLSQGGIQ